MEFKKKTYYTACKQYVLPRFTSGNVCRGVFIVEPSEAKLKLAPWRTPLCTLMILKGKLGMLYTSLSSKTCFLL